MISCRYHHRGGSRGGRENGLRDHFRQGIPCSRGSVEEELDEKLRQLDKLEEERRQGGHGK